MKKQFFRVKQTILRTGRSEQFNDELQEADHKVEYLKSALSSIGKKVGSATVSGPEAAEKKLKKYHEYQLGQVMLEFGLKEEESVRGLLKPILTKCSKAELELAREQAEHESKIESWVSAPLNGVLDNEVPNILKLKRNLGKLILDKDSANNRLQTAMKHGSKTDSIKDEMEEAEQKVEQCRDALAAEMFSLLRRESEFAQYMVQLVKLQRAYHESAMRVLENLIPDLEKEIGESSVKAVFGCDLAEHLRITRRQIALPLELCICALWELGMSEEGLFRVAGGLSKVKRMKLSIDSGCFTLPLSEQYRDVHVIASVLKTYLRDLPEPLLNASFYSEWIQAARTSSADDQRIHRIGEIVKRLPRANHDNLRYLVKFLAELAKNPANKMTPQNIAIVFAPNLLWTTNDRLEKELNFADSTALNVLVETLVMHEERFFPAKMEVYVMLKKEEMFPDLTEFERPVLTNLKVNAAGDDDDKVNSQLNNSLEGSSPTHGSPRPILRRKNKPAPVPPSFQFSRLQEANHVDRTNHNKVAAATNTDNKLVKRQSLELEMNNGSSSNNGSNSVCGEEQSPKQGKPGITKSDISAPLQTAEHASEPVQKVKIIAENLQQKSNCTTSPPQPVAAPRTTFFDATPLSPAHKTDPSSKSADSLSRSSGELLDIDGEVVSLRPRTESSSAKPVVPERPATLRPSSFRVARQSTLDEGPTTLERTSFYSVPDKQQVSIVRLGHDAQMAEKERFLGQQPDGTAATEARPDRPPKPELDHQLQPTRKPMTHGRTLSDGNIIDVVPTSPKSLARPPRPQPPPPPPPTLVSKAKSDADPGSTDL